MAEGELEHGCSFLEESWLIEHDPKADGGERTDDVAGVAEGEFEHGPRSPFRKSRLIEHGTKANGGERADDVASVAEGELEHRRFLSFVSCACVVPYLMNAVYTSGRAGTSAKLRNSAAYLYQRGTSDAQRTTQYCVARSSEGH